MTEPFQVPITPGTPPLNPVSSSAEPPRRAPRARWVVPIVVGLIVLLLVAGGALAYVALRGRSAVPITAGETMTVRGVLSVDDDVRETRMNGQPCGTEGGYRDIAEGASVVVSNSAGNTVAIGRLGAGHGEFGSNNCAFDFTVDSVPAGLRFYGIEVSHRGRVQYAEADLAKPVKLSLGSG